jgi:hypothetical protein
MYPKADEGAPLRRAQAPPPPATGFPMSGGGGYYQAGGATAAALAVQAQAPVAAWSTGLCDCFDDCSNCKQIRSRVVPPSRFICGLAGRRCRLRSDCD